MKDTKFMTAREKGLVLKAWETFLKHGCQKQHFTKGIYHHLIHNCSFIAHYDLGGFYATYFEEGEDKAHFLSQFDNRNGTPRSIEYGDTYWIAGGNDVCSEYYDINVAMCQVAAKYIPDLVANAQSTQKETDVQRARALLAKHGLKIAIRG